MRNVYGECRRYTPRAENFLRDASIMGNRMTYIKPERISLKSHPDYTEKWVQDRIAEDPTILGLGDLVFRDRERRHPRAGRFYLRPKGCDRPLFAQRCLALAKHLYESFPERDTGNVCPCLISRLRRTSEDSIQPCSSCNIPMVCSSASRHCLIVQLLQRPSLSVASGINWRGLDNRLRGEIVAQLNWHTANAPLSFEAHAW